MLNSGTYTLHNVLNYIPSSIKNNVADDDKLLSYAYQALEKLHLFETTFIKDIAFAGASNHKVLLPEDFRRIDKVKLLTTFNYNWVDFTIQDLFTKEVWIEMTSISPTSLNYITSVDFQDTQYLYTITNNELYTSCESGCIAIEYFKLNSNCVNEIQLPKDPQELWEYMANYALARYWESMMPTEGAFSLWNQYLQRTANLMEAAKRKINLSNLNYYNMRKIIFGDNRYAHLFQYMQNQTR